VTWLDGTRGRRLLLVALVLGHLIAISRQVDAGDGQSLLHRAVFSLLSPPQRLVGGTLRGVSGIWSRYVDLRGVHDENERLRQRVSELDAALRERRRLARETERLREVLGLQRILPYESIAAEVIAREGVPWFRTITVDRGSDAGVELNAPAISPSGVVGRVVAVGLWASRIQLLLDRDCGVGVMIESSGVTGVVSGQIGLADSGTADLMMNYVPAHAEVEVGDVVVTSGLDRIFPKGLMVGRVRAVGSDAAGLFREVRVTPSARFDRLEQVLLLGGPRPEPLFDESVR
jgi:rod shape-determining protein MreC